MVQLNIQIVIVVKDRDKYGVLKMDRNNNLKNMFGFNDSISIKQINHIFILILFSNLIFVSSSFLSSSGIQK